MKETILDYLQRRHEQFGSYTGATLSEVAFNTKIKGDELKSLLSSLIDERKIYVQKGEYLDQYFLTVS